MYNTGNHNPEQIVKNTNKYPLKGKADVVFQNDGTADVTVGVRTVKAGASYRMCSDTTILNNAPVDIKFIGAGTKDLWIHFIEPLVNGCEI